MSAELEQQIIDFLLTNREYNLDYALNLIKVLSCYIGECVKIETADKFHVFDDIYYYHILTNNFAGYVSNDGSRYSIQLIYKLKKISCVGYNFNYNVLNFCANENNMEMVKEHFNNNSLKSFRREIFINRMNMKSNMSIEWLFATTPTRSARN